MREAVLYEKLSAGRVRCHLCAHRCRLRDGQLGVCGVRLSRGGTLHTLVYGRAIAVHLDPIEKKPLFHFQPGSRTFSIATVGCNFRCRHCQNWEISQYGHLHRGEALPGDDLPPAAVVARARASGARSISYTYTEPTVFMEYALDTATLAHGEGLRNVFVTNGYLTPEAVDLVAPVLDAANVDVKGLDDEVMKRELKAHPAPVLDCVRRLKERGVWVEATTLLVPGSNDSDDEVRGIAELLASVDRDLPWHLSAFHPDYQALDRPRTPRRTLDRAMEIGRRAGLRFVYAGNVWDRNGESTACPGCGGVVIERSGFALGRVSLAAGRCASCGAAIAGVDLP